MYDEININVKIFYYIIRKSGFTTCVKLFRDYYTNIRIKKIEPQTLARMGFFVTTPAKKTAGKGVVENDKIKVTKKGKIKTTKIGYFFDCKKIV